MNGGRIKSPTVTPDLLERSNCRMNSNAKVLRRPSRHTADQCTTKFDQTLRSVDQSSEQTVRPLVQTRRLIRQAPHELQTPKNTQRQSRPRHLSNKGSQSTKQAQPSARSQSWQQALKPPRSSIRPHHNLERICRPSRSSQSQQAVHEMANQGVKHVVNRIEPVQLASNGYPNAVHGNQQPRRHAQEASHQYTRKPEQMPHRSLDRPPQSLKHVSNCKVNRSRAQQMPQSSQQLPASCAPLQRRSSIKSSGDGTSSKSYIELSPARRREIINSINESVQHVMTSMLSDKVNSAQWKPKLRKKGIAYYKDEINVKPGQTRFCCVSHTHATVEDIMKLFVVSDANSMARNNRVISGSLLETQVLSVLRRPTEQRPMSSMYVQYICYQNLGFMQNREACLAVATDMIHQPDGSTVGYCLWDTVDGPEFAEATQKLEPCIMFRSGFFIRRSGRQLTSDDGPNQSSTKIVYMVGLEPGGWAPGLAARMLMEKFGSDLARLCSHFRRKQLDSRTFVMKTEWPSKMSAEHCKHCKKPFQVLLNRVNCHSCGHVVCRSCVSKELVELHAVGLVPMYICFSCLKDVGLPVCTSQKARSSSGRRRLQSDTISATRSTTWQPSPRPQSYRQTKSVVESNSIEEDDDDSDTGEWAFTPSGVPVRPYHVAM